MDPEQLLAEFRSGLESWESHAGRIPVSSAYVLPLYIPVYSETSTRSSDSWLAWFPWRKDSVRKGNDGRIELSANIEEIYRLNKRVPAQLRTIELMEYLEARRQAPSWEVIGLASLFSAISKEIITTREAYHVTCALARDIGLAGHDAGWSRLMWATLPKAAPERYRIATGTAHSLGLVAGADIMRVLNAYKPARIRLDPRPARRYRPEAHIRARLDSISMGRPASSTLQWTAMTRDELTTRVWESSLQELSAEFGVSPQRLYRVCESMGVSTPPRGFWHAGERHREIIRKHHGISAPKLVDDDSQV